MGGGRAGMDETMRNMGKDLEVELTRLVAYLNDDVVPQVRRRCSLGLRVAADQLGRVADELERGPGYRAPESAAPRAADR